MVFIRSVLMLDTQLVMSQLKAYGYNILILVPSYHCLNIKYNLAALYTRRYSPLAAV